MLYYCGAMFVTAEKDYVKIRRILDWNIHV